MTDSPRLARCGAKFPAPALMQWTPLPCDKPDGHRTDHRSSQWLYEGRDLTRQRQLTCTWPDAGRPVAEEEGAA